MLHLPISEIKIRSGELLTKITNGAPGLAGYPHVGIDVTNGPGLDGPRIHIAKRDVPRPNSAAFWHQLSAQGWNATFKFHHELSRLTRGIVSNQQYPGTWLVKHSVLAPSGSVFLGFEKVGQPARFSPQDDTSLRRNHAAISQFLDLERNHQR